jgi:hypothetical protein
MINISPGYLLFYDLVGSPIYIQASAVFRLLRSVPVAAAKSIRRDHTRSLQVVPRVFYSLLLYTSI